VHQHSQREIRRLREEIGQTKESLQTIIEEREGTNEELRSANEEILSSNEELQSTNEELETSKEELQSTNEELTTLNEELQNRNLELKHLNDQLDTSRKFVEAIVETIREPLLVLDASQRVQMANRSFYSTFQVQRAATEGRSLYELGSGQWNL